MPVYAKRTAINDPRFNNRATTIIGGNQEGVMVTHIPVPDSVKLCDSCGKDLNTCGDTHGYLIYTSKANLKAERPWGFQCKQCAMELKPVFVIPEEGKVI